MAVRVARRMRYRDVRSTTVSRTEDLVDVKPAARRMWRIGGRRRERWRGEGEAMVCSGGLDWIHQTSLVVKCAWMSDCL